jgi:hypothetical protein
MAGFTTAIRSQTARAALTSAHALARNVLFPVAAISRQTEGDAMAKRNTSNRNAGPTTGGAAGSTSGSGSGEDRVIALAEQLGRIVGTMQAKAGGVLDRDALMQQISQVRDGANHLLEHLGIGGGDQAATGSTEPQQQASDTSSSRPNTTGENETRSRQQNSRRAAAGGRQKASAEATVGTGRQNNQPTMRGRSGGVVDAPGKKHRKPVANEVRANAADAANAGRLAKMKMVNASRRRGR